MKFTYCNEKCPKGIDVRDKLLTRYNSAYDALTDFRHFVEECSKSCPYVQDTESAKEDEVTTC